MSSPYANAPNYKFWRRAISSVEPHAIDPVVQTKFMVEPAARVATAGSCFAQHISRRLSAIGFNYFVPEFDETLEQAELARLGYGVFSARYGNIYTARQLWQLFQEAFWERPKSEAPWIRSDGRLVDPFRPTFHPDGFATADLVLEERSKHLAFVRQVFLESDVFVFTLGLTEGWMSSLSGDVYPVAPGASGGDFDPAIHRFVNFDVNEIVDDMNSFLEAFKAINPKVRVILTVSPVPLIATFEDRHVLVSTVYSKSVLRVAADMISRNRDWVEYFPSYEIITGNFNGGRYYEDDLREINSMGVSHAMRCFLDNYVHGGTERAEASPEAAASRARADARTGPTIVCDEEALDMISV
jgi:hypothetical protein